MAKVPAGKAKSRARKGADPSAGQPAGQPGGADKGEGSEPSGDHAFPVVGVGASAGGLEAFTQLLAHLPEKTGMAFVLVQHLDPKHESKLTDLLSRATRMPVTEVTDGLAVSPNHVYVIPPNTNMSIAGGVLELSPRGAPHRQNLPVDYLFQSLAKDQQRSAIGVILSGTGSDGTLGLSEIKAAGGITFAQDEKSAKYSGMPQAAIASGCVDFILPPAEIAREVARIGRHPYLSPAPSTRSESLPSEDEDHFKKILALLRTTTGADFSEYRDTTLKRRIMRRMAVHTRQTLGDYVRHLEGNRPEIEALYGDILITVTSFFRDPEMFEALKRSVFPGIAKTKPSVIRLWAPACSTGQEAYSLAIALLEFWEEKPARPSIQIFATDISDSVTIEKARAGFYPESIEAEVSPARLRRFFTKEAGGYRIAKSIREMCIFAKQNVTADPPFSRVDLISCRNLLIYLGAPLQRRVISTFHYALNHAGFLVLGASETVGGSSNLFGLVDRTHKIYSKKATAARPYPHFIADHVQVTIGAHATGKSQPAVAASQFLREADRIVLSRYAPAGVLVNDDLEVLQFRGRTGPYLEPPAGEASFNLLKMARENLALELGTALREARKKNAAVRRQGVRLRDDRRERDIDLEVIPVKLPGGGESCFLVLFEEAGLSAGAEPVAAAPAGHPAAPDERDRELDQLRRDLAAAREYLQSIIEQQEAANEELRSANEEVLSSNEELQSTNEELETTKEELQSAIQELTTVNEELQTRNTEINQVNNDLTNLLGSVRIPIVMLGSDLHIRRFNAAAGTVLNLIPTDLGRPIGHMNPLGGAPDLEQLIMDVIGDVVVREREVQDREGRWYALRIHPYRTADNRIDGAVLALIDIDEVKRAQEQLQQSADYTRAIVETMRDPLLVLTADLRVNTANRSFYQTFHVGPEETEGRLIYELGNGQWNIPRLRILFEEVLPASAAIQDFEVEHDFEQIGRRTMLLNAQVLRQREGLPERILLAIEDITQRDQAVEDLRASETRFKEANRRKDEFLAMLGHELRTPLATVSNAAQALDRIGSPDPQAVQLRALVIRQARHLARLVDDLLDVARITRGQINLRIELVELSTVVGDAVESVRPLIESRRHEFIVSLGSAPIWLQADPTRLEQILVNLLNNAIKYTEPGGSIRLTAKREDPPGSPPSQGGPVGDGSWVVLRVEDTGVGIPAEMLASLFEPFTQLDRSMERAQDGLGIGLSLARSLVEMHGGTVRAHSAGPGQGSAFVVRLPLAPEKRQGQVAEKQRDDAQPVAASPTRRILVVDDHVDSAESLGVLLGILGHDVRVAHDGPGAIEAAVAFQPDAVLLDIGLPGMHGYEVARRMRAEPGLKHIRLAALTGWGQDQDRRRSREAGFDHHLVKPVDLDVLRAWLTSLELPKP